MNPIFAKKVKLIQHNGFTVDYTHVTHFCVAPSVKLLYITGETLDSFGMPRISHDNYHIKDINLTIIEWYEPKT